MHKWKTLVPWLKDNPAYGAKVKIDWISILAKADEVFGFDSKQHAKRKLRRKSNMSNYADGFNAQLTTGEVLTYEEMPIFMALVSEFFSLSNTGKGRLNNSGLESDNEANRSDGTGKFECAVRLFGGKSLFNFSNMLSRIVI